MESYILRINTDENLLYKLLVSTVDTQQEIIIWKTK